MSKVLWFAGISLLVWGIIAGQEPCDELIWQGSAEPICVRDK